ncbi:hypothetical protein AN640_08825 [Candidatus Epulonipiscium fishelsonii]|uniref:Uncharacterized protein n=1 Tax=Candidatus Epulonipiscium fishelsonii TaxID=77094 RepID=A0ACC8XC58_9FIRM|nr:hypothetical protein AN640_08825 [Epulopiscium sp. SCG-D08WGA-EpuloA1]
MIIDKIKELLVTKVISRRSFLKSSALSGIALLGLTGCASEQDEVVDTSTVEPIEEPAPVAPREQNPISRHACPRNCYDTCSILCEVKDGKITRVSGDPGNPITAGGLCVKMNHYLSWVYHADRILYPLKRVGAKGEGKFEQITWEEALDTIATKTKANIDAYGPETVLKYNISGTVGFVHNYGLSQALFNKMGTSILVGSACAGSGSAAIPYTYGKNAGVDPEEFVNTKLYVSWGANEAAVNVHTVKFIKQCKENGGKIVIVNPVRPGLLHYADMFIQIKPGTDAAFALGVANYIIENNLQNQAYIDAYTVGFEELKTTASEYTLEKTSEITGVPIEQIIEFSKMYGEIKPSVIRIGFGMQRHSNGGSMVRAITLLPPLVGAIGKDASSGYVYINSGYWISYAGIQGNDLRENPNARKINMNELGKALTGELETTKDYPISTLLLFNSNPMAIIANGNRVRRGLLREDLFTVVADIFRTDTADYADIILPASTFFEYEELCQDYMGWYLRHNSPAIEPLGESKSNCQMFSELAKRMGYTDPIFDMTTEEAIKVCLQAENVVKQGITYDNLKEKGWVKLDLGVPYGDMKFPTPSGKIEFYSEKLKEAGHHPVAAYVPRVESEDGSPDLFKKYPLTLISAHTKNFINSHMHNVPQINELIEESAVFIHTDDANERGITDGDSITVTNDRGTILMVAKVTPTKTQKGTLLSYSCHWPKLVEGGKSVNELTPDRVSDMGGGPTFHTNLVEIAKA